MDVGTPTLAYPAEDLDEFFENAATAMHWVDADGVIIRANRRELETLGYEAHEYIGRPIADFHADPGAIADILDRLGRNETLRDYEARLVARDGSIRHVVIDSNVRRSEDGRFLHTRCFTRDVTDRKLAEVELERAREELEQRVAERTAELERSRSQLLEAQRIARLGSWELDLETGSSDPSDELCRILGLEAEPLETFHARFIDLIHPDDRDLRRLAVEPTLRGEGPFDYEVRITRPDGAVRRLQVLGRADLDADGVPTRLVGTAQDITELRQLEEERRQFDASWQEAQRLESLGVLAGGIAHDFNNLLVGVLGNASIALEELPPGSPGRERVEDIELASRRAAELTKQLLAYSGQGSFVVQRVDLVELVRELGHLLETVVSKKVRLEYDLVDQETIVEADATELRQVVMNLIVNASEAHGDRSGSVRLRVGTVEVGRSELDSFTLGELLLPGEHALLEVADEGQGMSSETQARIFDPFFTSKEGGHGLGLTGVLGIVRAQGGAIRVRSEPGRGSTFTILLPLCADADLLPSRPEPPAAETGSTATILVADDEEAIRKVAGTMLRRAGFEVVTAADGDEAVSLFTEYAGTVDAVVLDLMMPGRRGDEVLEELRAIRPDLPVIVSSGYTAQALDATLESGREIAFVQKPYTPAELVETVRSSLERQPPVAR